MLSETYTHNLSQSVAQTQHFWRDVTLTVGAASKGYIAAIAAVSQLQAEAIYWIVPRRLHIDTCRRGLKIPEIAFNVNRPL